MKRLAISIIFVLMLAIPAGAERVTLGWDANTESIDGYVVYRSLVSGSGYASMDIVPCTANDPVCCEYLGEQLLWGTTYYWVVTAFSSGGESGYSNEVTYTTPSDPSIPPQPPNNPTNCYIKTIIP